MLTWKRRGKRVLWGYTKGGHVDVLIFGAPAPSRLWCWVLWHAGGRESGFASSLRHVKAEVQAAFLAKEGA